MPEDAIDRVVAESRARQGLTPKIEDPATLARALRLLGLSLPERADAPGISRTRRAADHLSPAKGDRRGTG